jgi:NAD(P)-dependent dehydrogenase (short-subunit alcohol dehydrogenase family)
MWSGVVNENQGTAMALTEPRQSASVAVVTGGGGGIGRAVALALLAAGYSVTIAGRSPDALEQTISEAGPLADSILGVTADVRVPSSVRGLFDSAITRFGRVDLLFNNAGVLAPAVPLEDLEYDDWRAVLDSNLTGAFLCTQQAIRIMKSQSPRGGRIINNGSVSAHVPRAQSVAYTAAKHGIAGLTKSTALDGRDHDIACGQIDIGNAATDMTTGLGTEPRIALRHVVDAVLYMARLPLDANVLCLTVMATKMPYVGRG